MESTEATKSPLSPSAPLFKYEEEQVLDDPNTYESLVGALQYCVFTRLDIAFLVNRLCQFLHVPTDVHWTTFKSIALFKMHSSLCSFTAKTKCVLSH